LIYPEDEMTNVSVTPTLQWENPVNSPRRTGIYIYLGTSDPPYSVDSSQMNRVATLDADDTSWTVYPALDHETTYYWQVVPYNETGLSVGNAVSSFSTQLALPEPVWMISPFEEATSICVLPTFSWVESTCTISGYYLYLSTSRDLFNPEEPETNRIAIIPKGDDDYISWTPTTALEYYTIYFWVVVAYNTTGIGGSRHSWAFQTMLEVEVDDIDIVPLTTELIGNFPNPFNPITNIRYQVSGIGDQFVQIEVYDIRGRLVRTLLDGSREFGAGKHSVVWDGRDDNGVQVSSGVYFYRMRAGEYVAMRRMVLMK
jgi:hypothetical protein